MGPSGCGKTTLLRILMGFEKPDAGSITGMPEKLSAVFQENRLTEDFSGVENICLVLERGTRKERVELAEWHLARMGLKDSMEQPVRELSGGMKRRVAIIRAVLAEANLILLDEPFKGLDEVTKDTVMEYFMESTKEKTTIVVTHDPLEVKKLGVNHCNYIGNEASDVIRH